MKKHIYLASLLAMGASLSACDDLINPAIENINSMENYYSDPTSSYGIMSVTYNYFSFPHMPECDYATDDAVSNDLDNNWRKTALGSWTSQNNPTSKWNDYLYSIQTINIFLENANNVKWYGDEIRNNLQLDHFIGEAHALRAIFNYYLLMQHAGKVNGELTGILLHTSSEDGSTNFNQSRASFADCYKAIIEDLDDAITRLPDHYQASWKSNEIPARLLEMGATPAYMNRINGSYCIGHVDGRICKAYRALASLMAASPAYNAESWENATTYAQSILNSVGGLDALSKLHVDWFVDDTYLAGASTKETPVISIWFNGKFDDNGDEGQHYPPSMNGLGRCNPSQNLVDAFPMANGYPITHPSSGYDPKKPYDNRDPRLDLYILHDGAQFRGTTVSTAVDGSNIDGLNSDAKVSTRTGYYMRKLLNPVADPTSTNKKNGQHLRSRVRTIEAFLAYAEASNEAAGPTAGSPSAYDVMKKLREVSGITGGDQYLESIKSDQAKMRELIRNERRICLCFENKRFWDLRRWNAIDELKAPVKGMRITGSGSNKNYEVFEVETRNYKDYQIYCPIPYSEVVRYSNLKQNDGWN